MYCWNTNCINYNVPKIVTPQNISGVMVCGVCYQSVGVHPHDPSSPNTIQKIERNLIDEYHQMEKIKKENNG